MSVSTLRLDHHFALPVSRMTPGLINPKQACPLLLMRGVGITQGYGVFEEAQRFVAGVHGVSGQVRNSK